MSEREKCCNCFELLLVALTIASPLSITCAVELALKNSHESRKSQSISHSLNGVNEQTHQENMHLRLFVTVMLFINAIFMHLIVISRNIQLEDELRMQKQYSMCWFSMNWLSTLFGILFSICFASLAIVHDDNYPIPHAILSSTAFICIALWITTHTLLTIRSLWVKAECCGISCCKLVFISGLMLVWSALVLILIIAFGVSYAEHDESSHYLDEWMAVYLSIWYTPIVGFFFTQDSIADELQELFCRCSRRRLEQKMENVEQMPSYLVSV